jgi:4-hydroxybenzoyl-CoA thioesterase
LLRSLAESLEPVDPARILRLSCRSMAMLRSTRQFVVEWGHCDPAGIVFNPRFFEYFDWGTWNLFEMALGVKPHELTSSFGIMGIPLVDAGAKFIGPAKFGDTIEQTSWVSEFRRSSFDVTHELRVHGALAVDGKETRVWAIRDAADPTKIRSHPIPPEVAARFAV